MKTEVKIKLAHTKKGTISLKYLLKPYGEKSSPVVSIGISIAGAEEPDYKVHIPVENLVELMENLKILMDNEGIL